MITLSDDEVALIRSLLTSIRSIKVRDIDKALVILSKAERLSNNRLLHRGNGEASQQPGDQPCSF
jgi:predicted DNA-binding transcriptional regulator